jgi:polyisoprenoid-binding protein YceI
MTRIATSLFLAASMSTLSLTAATAAPSIDSVKKGRYAIDGAHTQVGFSISHFGFTNYSGLFAGATGTLNLDPAQAANDKLDVTIPMDSIITTVPKLTDELKGGQWFDSVKFPQASYTSNAVAVGPGGEITITGNLTLHGVSKPVTLHAHLMGAGVNPIDKKYTVGFEAKAKVKRTDFGVSLYAPALGEEVELLIAGAFELQE